MAKGVSIIVDMEGAGLRQGETWSVTSWRPRRLSLTTIGRGGVYVVPLSDYLPSLERLHPAEGDYVTVSGISGDSAALLYYKKGASKKDYTRCACESPGCHDGHHRALECGNAASYAVKVLDSTISMCSNCASRMMKTFDAEGAEAIDITVMKGYEHIAPPIGKPKKVDPREEPLFVRPRVAESNRPAQEGTLLRPAASSFSYYVDSTQVQVQRTPGGSRLALDSETPVAGPQPLIAEGTGVEPEIDPPEDFDDLNESGDSDEDEEDGEA